MSYLTDYPFLNTTGIDPLPLKKKEGLGEREGRREEEKRDGGGWEEIYSHQKEKAL